MSDEVARQLEKTRARQKTPKKAQIVLYAKPPG